MKQKERTVYIINGFGTVIGLEWEYEKLTLLERVDNLLVRGVTNLINQTHPFVYRRLVEVENFLHSLNLDKWVESAVTKFKQNYREVVISGIAIIGAGIIAVYAEQVVIDSSKVVKQTTHITAVTTPTVVHRHVEKHHTNNTVHHTKKVKKEVKTVHKTSSVSTKKTKSIIRVVLQIENCFRSQRNFAVSYPDGTNLTLLRKSGKVKSPIVSRKEWEENIVGIFLFVKKNYENSTYNINALSKTGQVLIETNDFKSLLFNIGGNIGGQKAFNDEAYFLSLDDKLNCKPGEYPYSRFIKWTDPLESLRWGCESLLQKPRYSGKNSYGHSPKDWIRKVHSAGYAINPDYVPMVCGKVEVIKKVLDKYKIKY